MKKEIWVTQMQTDDPSTQKALIFNEWTVTSKTLKTLHGHKYSYSINTWKGSISLPVHSSIIVSTRVAESLSQMWRNLRNRLSLADRSASRLVFPPPRIFERHTQAHTRAKSSNIHP